MTGIIEKRVKVIVRTSRKSRKSGNTASRKRPRISFAQTKEAKFGVIASGVTLVSGAAASSVAPIPISGVADSDVAPVSFFFFFFSY